MKVSVEWIEFLCEEMAKINRLNTEDIIFTEKGIRVDIPWETIDKFAYTGLKNMDFITYGYYKERFTKVSL